MLEYRALLNYGFEHWHLTVCLLGNQGDDIVFVAKEIESKVSGVITFFSDGDEDLIQIIRQK